MHIWQKRRFLTHYDCFYIIDQKCSSQRGLAVFNNRQINLLYPTSGLIYIYYVYVRACVIAQVYTGVQNVIFPFHDNQKTREYFFFQRFLRILFCEARDDERRVNVFRNYFRTRQVGIWRFVNLASPLFAQKYRLTRDSEKHNSMEISGKLFKKRFAIIYQILNLHIECITH